MPLAALRSFSSLSFSRSSQTFMSFSHLWSFLIYFAFVVAANNAAHSIHIGNSLVSTHVDDRPDMGIPSQLNLLASSDPRDRPRQGALLACLKWIVHTRQCPTRTRRRCLAWCARTLSLGLRTGHPVVVCRCRNQWEPPNTDCGAPLCMRSYGMCFWLWIP